MDKWAFPAVFEISSDAATSSGCAAILGDSRFALCRPDELDLTHISILELVPLFWLPVSGACFGKARD